MIDESTVPAFIALEDGFVLEGLSFAARGERAGEVVFNTSMFGYQEILTDPSYKGQIVTMTYPLIGNYGTNEEDFESANPHVEGFIVREASRIASNWRSQLPLQDYLLKHEIMGIEGVDTRALVRHIRTQGAMKAVISTEDLDKESLVEKAKESPGLVGQDLVKLVTCERPYSWRDAGDGSPDPPARFRVIVIDYGVKHNILRMLQGAGCEVIVVPASTTAEHILSQEPDGIVLSNGPGDPEGIRYAVEEVKDLLGRKPIFGICMGHEVLGLAFGGSIFKLKFGHRGANQPVKEISTGRVRVTSQNHGFGVDIDSLKDPDVELTHFNLNDQTLEGIRHKSMPIFSVQYHPEASPGPHDSEYLFEEFVTAMSEAGGGKN